MPTIQPFQYVKATAFKERVDIINKLNEIVDVINQGGTTPTDITIISKDGYYTMVISDD